MKTLIRITSAIVAIITLIFSTTSCHNAPRDVFSYQGAAITEDMYRYWLSYYKSYYSKNFYDVSDTEEGWQKEIGDGLTVEQYVIESVNSRMKMYTAAIFLFDKYSLELSSDAQSEINNTIESLIEDYGSKSKLDNALRKSCNTTIEGLKNVYRTEYKLDALKEYLYGSNGINKLSESEIDDYYKTNYSLIKYLYFDKVNKYKYNDDGSIMTDVSGNYLTQPLTEDEIAQREALAKEALGRAKAGEDFNMLITEYNTVDMDYSSSYPDGYYISKSSYTSSYVYTVVYEGMNMEEDDVILCDDDYAFYVIARYPLPDKGYNTDSTGQLDSIADKAAEYFFNSALSQIAEEVEVNEEYISSVRLSSLGAGVGA